MKLIDIIKNIFLRSQVVYIVELADWSIKWDGYYIVKNLQKLITARCSSSVLFIKNSIIHFGSVNTYITDHGFKKVHTSNKIILTWFHVAPNDPRLKFVKELNNRVVFVHTTSEITKNELIKNGLDSNKIIVIPLGVDLQIFRPVAKEEKKKIKTKLGLPLDKIIIGSFQKDGVGWGEGNEPKLIKGPDIFCEVVRELAKQYSVHVLLTGPARGYVKKNLSAAGVSFTHNYVKNFSELANYYNVLDLYLITSRVEGGPKSLLESMACGVSFVTTPVGMADVVVKNKVNGLTAQSFDPKEIFVLAKEILEDKKTAENYANNALVEVKNYSWNLIGSYYFDNIYKKLL